MGKVIDFSTRRELEPPAEKPADPVDLTPTCFACKHAMFGQAGTYCPIYSESIWNEKLAAEDCEQFERDP